MECGDRSCNPWKRKGFDVFPDLRDLMEEIWRNGLFTPESMVEFTIVTADYPTDFEFKEERKPFIDVIKGDKDVSVIIEMPGVEKEDIDIRASETHVEIRAERGDRKYHERIEFDCEVIPDQVKATYNNGVLEIVFKRKKPEEDKKLRKIEVE